MAMWNISHMPAAIPGLTISLVLLETYEGCKLVQVGMVVPFKANSKLGLLKETMLGHVTFLLVCEGSEVWYKPMAENLHLHLLQVCAKWSKTVPSYVVFVKEPQAKRNYWQTYFSSLKGLGTGPQTK